MQFWNRRKTQLQEEIQNHIELEIEENLQSGMPPEQAREAAQKKFGNILLAVERSREIWGALWLEYLLQDLRYALRSLRRAPGYSAAVLLTLALGLGSVATILAIIDSVLLRPVSLPHPRQLVVIYGKSDQSGVWQDLSFAQIDTLRRECHSFSEVNAYESGVKAVGTPDGVRVALYAGISPGFFSMLGVQPTMGRILSSNGARRPVVLVSYDFWQERLHGERDVIGSPIQLQGTARTIIGVLPRGLELPFASGGPAVYAPVSLNVGAKQKGSISSGFALVLARLKPGVSIAQAQAEARNLLIHEHDSNGANGHRLMVTSLTRFLTGDIEKPLLALLGGVLILLLIACANAANLQIARATERLSEMQVRSSLGASFPRLLQQLVVESLVISLAGAAVGCALAIAATSAIRSTYDQEFPRFKDIAVHPSVLLALALLAVMAGLLASLAPAFSIRSRTARAASQRTVTPRNRVSSVLVILQIALTCILLVTCGLFLQTFRALQHVPPGFNPHHLTLLVLMPENSQQPPTLLRQADHQLLDRFEALPGVQAATMQTSFPFANFTYSMNGSTNISGRPFNKNDAPYYTIVSSNFVRVSGIRLLRGRSFLPQDDGSANMVALVNQAFVDRFMRGRNPIGVSLSVHIGPKVKDSDIPVKQPFTIVGVLQNELQSSDLGSAFKPLVYLDDMQIPKGSSFLALYDMMSQFAIRSSLPQDALDKEIRSVLHRSAPDMAEMQLDPMEKSITDSLGERRLALRLVSGFGALALLLAGIGIYGLLAYAVALRRREIGIRMALGSSRVRVTRLVLRQAARLVLWGLIPGIAGAWAAEHAVRSFLFGTKALDPLAVAASVAVLAATAGIAAAVPAWRAARVDPMEVLRNE